MPKRDSVPAASARTCAPKDRYTLRDIVGDKYERIFHMGRLDYDSEGLILMTNDGELSQHVMHPKYEVEKT